MRGVSSEAEVFAKGSVFSQICVVSSEGPSLWVTYLFETRVLGLAPKGKRVVLCSGNAPIAKPGTKQGVQEEWKSWCSGCQAH